MATTGYVSLIDNGEITNPKDFLKVCLRAFGIMNRQMGESLSLESVENIDFSLKNDSTYAYYKKSLESDMADLKEIEEKSDSDKEIQNKAYIEFIRYYEEQLDESIKNKNKCLERNAKLDYYIEKITQWDCSENYKSIKEFAIKQLAMCKETTEYYDQSIKRYKDMLDNPIESFKKYMNNQIECVRESLKQHETSLFECIEENNKKKEFYEGFLSELEKMQ